MTIDVATLCDETAERLGCDPQWITPLEREGLRIFAKGALAPQHRTSASVEVALDRVRGNIARLLLLTKHAEGDGDSSGSPIFIIAGARTGSTLLQALLALEPSFHSPRLEDLWRPFEDDARVRRREAAELLRGWPSGALRLHPMAVGAPDECHWIMTHSPIPAMFHLGLEYWDWLKCLQRDCLTELYEGYKRQAKFLHRRAPHTRWLSKTFAHMYFWPVLFDVFPDAYVIRLHRNPTESIGSTCSLVQHLAPGSDPLLVGELALDILHDGLSRMIRSELPLRADQVIDVQYKELCERPGHVVRQVAQRVGVTCTQELEARVARYLQSPKRLRASAHAYSLEEYGLSAASVTERLEAYLDWAQANLGERL